MPVLVPCCVCQSRRVLLPARPPVPYDLLSVDIGITPAAAAVPGAAAHTLPVKPIDKYVECIMCAGRC
jgi:selenide,water dikinase